MIYLITEGELQALVSCAAYDCSSISPLSIYVDETKIGYGKTFEQRANGLKELGLLSSAQDEDEYLLTPEGTLMLNVLLQPECVATVGMKNSEDNVFHLMKKENIWYVFTIIPHQKMCVIVAYFSTEGLASFLDQQFMTGFLPDKPHVGKIDISLTPEEWYVFLASQLVFDKRESVQLSLEQYEYFTLEDIQNNKAIDFFRSGFGELKLEDDEKKLSAVLYDESGEKLESIKNSLVEKGIFALYSSPEGKEVITYTDAAISWLDNDMLIDTLFFNIKKPDSDYTILFSKRRTGITSLFDRGSDVRIVSSNQIPWEFYLR